MLVFRRIILPLFIIASITATYLLTSPKGPPKVFFLQKNLRQLSYQASREVHLQSEFGHPSDASVDRILGAPPPENGNLAEATLAWFKNTPRLLKWALDQRMISGEKYRLLLTDAQKQPDLVWAIDPNKDFPVFMSKKARAHDQAQLKIDNRIRNNILSKT